MGAGLSQTEIFAMANKIRSTLVVATILATVLLLINRLFIIEGVGVVGGVGPYSCPHLAAPRPSPASRQSAQACASRTSSWSSIRPATSSRDYSEQPSHNKRSEKPRPLHEHSSKREDLDPNYTPNYEEPVMSVGLELVVVRVLSKERPCIILRHDAECDTGFSEMVYLLI